MSFCWSLRRKYLHGYKLLDLITCVPVLVHTCSSNRIIIILLCNMNKVTVIFLSLTIFSYVSSQGLSRNGLTGRNYMEKQLLCALEKGPCDVLGSQIKGMIFYLVVCVWGWFGIRSTSICHK